jgi:hypothetical protein
METETEARNVVIATLLALLQDLGCEVRTEYGRKWKSFVHDGVEYPETTWRTGPEEEVDQIVADGETLITKGSRTVIKTPWEEIS